MNIKISTLLLLITVLFCTTSYAQEGHSIPASERNGLSVRMVQIGYQAPYLKDKFSFVDYGRGFELGYNNAISRKLTFYLPLRITQAQFDQENEHTIMLGAEALLKYYFKSGDVRWDPYAIGGIGGTYETDGLIHGAVPVGLGIALNLNKTTQLNLDAQYRFGLSWERRSAIQVGIGMTSFFGDYNKEEPRQLSPDEIDTDGDGIPDYLDECPDVPGLPEFNGCPDTDGDGIPDHLDECPDVPGLPEFNGCPDTDGDGIPDHLDECPDVPGLPEFNGCPDTDGDGVPDHLDECPDVPGLPEFNGCPDTDGDGVPDHLDECPDVPGPPEYDGCPDSDGDGVPDHLDLCPDTPGPKSNFGCPEIDEEDKAALDEAMESVQFETAKATLKDQSFKVLDNVVRILKGYPDYDLRIIGHTDNVGSAESNLILSQNRARSCYEYIASRGISTSRLSYVGMGDSLPRATNSTEDGRAKNRRVEFNLYIRN